MPWTPIHITTFMPSSISKANPWSFEGYGSFDSAHALRTPGFGQPERILIRPEIDQ